MAIKGNTGKSLYCKKPMLGRQLSERERQVALLIAKGLTNDEISKIIFISSQTVKNHITSIFLKTGLHNRVQVAMIFAPELQPSASQLELPLIF